ncbi:hypothetical protein [Desulfovermiculus halophilus]|jgi:hypothetical protein|uniref:hypothetical protein n=1 Tax=Desulfovermiculus halophilus TaxID=339722 RepID=UPI00048039E7|nr:hypothetical protein [Desulfovermiculus halophilus]
MRSYRIDEMLPEQAAGLFARLQQDLGPGPMQGIIWIQLPSGLLTPQQLGHLDSCGPYILSLEAGSTWIQLELLVRARQTFRCDCIGFATPEQRAYGIGVVDQAVLDLGLGV